MEYCDVTMRPNAPQMQVEPRTKDCDENEVNCFVQSREAIKI